jgi:hypothetical protein
MDALHATSIALQVHDFNLQIEEKHAFFCSVEPDRHINFQYYGLIRVLVHACASFAYVRSRLIYIIMHVSASTSAIVLRPH